LANLLHDYAETTIEEEVAQRRIQSAAKELNQMGEIYNKFNKHAREEVVERLKNWCNGRDGGYLQLRKSMATLDETRSKLNEGMKQASITDLDEAGEHECTQKLRRQYDESLDKMQQGIEQFYNGLVSFSKIFQSNLCNLFSFFPGR
jgi:translation initiation factor 2B subunit (eIF-2B alpha/beta/delta family)